MDDLTILGYYVITISTSLLLLIYIQHRGIKLLQQQNDILCLNIVNLETKVTEINTICIKLNVVSDINHNEITKLKNEIKEKQNV